MSNKIEFKLLAPYNKAASLIGSFSDWEAIPMQKDEDGYFRTFIELEDGVYQYKYKIQSISWTHQQDEWVEINDPYVTELDPNTNNGILRIEEGKWVLDTYVWQHDDVPLPSNNELIIYEMLVSDFADGEEYPEKPGTYQAIIKKLDYLGELGINAIELMPINKTPGDRNWGYTPSYFLAPNPKYGSSTDLKKLIDECHARGIRVIFDQIYNHSSTESPLLAIDHDYWYHHDQRNPDEEFSWGPEFNYQKYDEFRSTYPARDFMGDVVRYWIYEYHIDGIRYDALKQMGNHDFLQWLTQEGRNKAGEKPFYNAGEYIPEQPEMLHPDNPLDACWHESFYFFIRDLLCGDDFDLTKLKQLLKPQKQNYPNRVETVVNYVNNHDHARLLADLGDRDIFGQAAFNRAKLGVVILMTAVGIPMLFMGEEFGEYKNLSLDTIQKLDWSLLENDDNLDLLEFYKTLITLRKQNPILAESPNIDWLHENPEVKVIAYIRWNDQGARIVTVANFSDQFLKDYEINNLPENGTWHEWTKDYDVEVKDGKLTLDLGEYEAQVFIWQ